MKRAATNYQDGETTGFELVAKYVSDEDAYLVEVEQGQGQDGRTNGREPHIPALHEEDGNWRLVHRRRRPNGSC
jgi:hypothetical protein